MIMACVPCGLCARAAPSCPCWGLSEELAARAAELGIRAEAILVEPDHAAMRALAALAEAGKLRTELAAIVPLAEAAKAHELGETNRTSGKIVLTVLRLTRTRLPAVPVARGWVRSSICRWLGLYRRYERQAIERGLSAPG